MKKFCVVANMEKDRAAEAAEKIRRHIESKGCECHVLANELHCEGEKNCYTRVGEIKEGTECVIVLGGDGTMIQAAKDTAQKDIPLYGINIGGVGFLTESDTHNMEDNIDRLISDDFRVEKRMMLEGRTTSGKGKSVELALNDFAIFRREFGKLIRFAVYINGELLDSFIADGVIVSTPTGSTGYNISAGGPVIAPNVNAIAVTPVCPHSLNDRSFIINGNDSIEIKLLEGKNSRVGSAVISVDGRMLGTIDSGDSVYMKKSDIATGIVLMKKTNFYKKMRRKLTGGGFDESAQTEKNN